MLGLLWYQAHQGQHKASLRSDIFLTKNIRYAIEGAETAQRGYLIVGDISYIEQDYADAVFDYQRDYHDLKTSLEKQHDLLNLARLRQAHEVIVNKLDEMQRTIRLYQENKSVAAWTLVRTNEGHRYMRDIRTILSDIQADKQLQMDSSWMSVVQLGAQLTLNQ